MNPLEERLKLKPLRVRSKSFEKLQLFQKPLTETLKGATIEVTTASPKLLLEVPSTKRVEKVEFSTESDREEPKLIP